MEPYFKKYFLIEEVVLPPKHLDSNLFENLRIILTNKYPKTYLNKGYIFNIKIISILDNKITLSSQIILKVKFQADLYVPKVDHIFQGEIKKSAVVKYHWVEIGPLKIYLNNIKSRGQENGPVTVQITDIKSDNTLCSGKIL
jgi:DNA-directed RNA polymerase subunit E'/Rpb7